jgi:ParB-like chromosome segregation protein Spo0J
MMMGTETVKLSQLKPHPKNVRQGDIGAISESLQAHGQYRPIVVQKSTNHILAGNHTFKAAKALGWKELSVTYIDCDDDEATRILLVDNRANDIASYDDSALIETLKTLMDTELKLAGTGFDADDLDQLLRDLDKPLTNINETNEALSSADPNELTTPTNALTQAVKAPQYQIVGKQPAVTELFDDTQAKQLQQQINKADIPDDIKQFLTVGTYRHIVFNYSKIAEYFPHATKEVQELMRESVLVIIDMNDAIRLGYLRFEARINELEEGDRDESE